MARGHYASKYSDGGELLGKDGKPLPTTPMRGMPTLNPHAEPAPLQHMDDGEIVEAAPKASVPPAVEQEFVCGPATWQRNMDGWQALHIMRAILAQKLGEDDMTVVLSEAAVRDMKLPADVRLHFRRRPVERGEEG